MLRLTVGGGHALRLKASALRSLPQLRQLAHLRNFTFVRAVLKLNVKRRRFGGLQMVNIEDENAAIKCGAEKTWPAEFMRIFMTSERDCMQRKRLRYMCS
jgi:hypothetical protein